RNLVCKTGEAACAVAAHLCFSTVGIKITHPEIRAVGGIFEQQDSVGANAAVAIAQARNLAAKQMNVPRPVIDQDEIVSSTIHFGETQHHADCSGSFLS